MSTVVYLYFLPMCLGAVLLKLTNTYRLFKVQEILNVPRTLFTLLELAYYIFGLAFSEPLLQEVLRLYLRIVQCSKPVPRF